LATLPELYPDFDVLTSRIAITAGADNILVRGNSQRFALLIGISTAVQTWIWPEAMSAANQGMLFSVGFLQFTLNFRDHGPLVGRDWHLWCATPGQTAMIIETVYKPR
jgi:hypothetical protein